MNSQDAADEPKMAKEHKHWWERVKLHQKLSLQVNPNSDNEPSSEGRIQDVEENSDNDEVRDKDVEDDEEPSRVRPSSEPGASLVLERSERGPPAAPEDVEDEGPSPSRTRPSSRPGAFFVPGPGEPSPPAAPEEAGGVPSEEVAVEAELATSEDERQVMSEEERHQIEEETERRLTRSIVTAQYVNLDNKRKRRMIVSSVAVLLLVALIIGLVLGLTSDSQPNSTESELGTLEAVVIANDPGSQNFFEARRYALTVDGEKTVTTTGFMFAFFCTPIACMESDDMCGVGYHYEPGCCAGPNCSNETKCGELCPIDPYPCHPIRENCHSASCIKCEEGSNGEELYTVYDFTVEIACLHTGTKVTADGKSYKWAVACGPMQSGGSEEQNLAKGEYLCYAFRQGDGIDPNTNATRSMGSPCQWIQLTECGCAPLDVYDFGVGRPEKPCKTKNDCPFLCSDVPEEVKKTCYALDIDWFEGYNSLGNSKFLIPDKRVYDESATKIDIFL